MTINCDFSLISAIYILLIAYGIGYGALIEMADRRGYTEGFAWLAAGIWALVTVGAMAAICWQMALVLLGAFLCSGLPIAARMIWRFWQLREHEQEAIRRNCLRANILEEDEDDVR